MVRQDYPEGSELLISIRGNHDFSITHLIPLLTRREIKMAGDNRCPKFDRKTVKVTKSGFLAFPLDYEKYFVDGKYLIIKNEIIARHFNDLRR